MTRSESNTRNRWGTIRRKELAREATIEALAVALAKGQSLPEQGPWFVKFTRISPNRLDDDNLRAPFKSIRDTVAAALGIDDGSPDVQWDYGQAHEGRYLGVIIEVWNHAPLRTSMRAA